MEDKEIYQYRSKFKLRNDSGNGPESSAEERFGSVEEYLDSLTKRPFESSSRPDMPRTSKKGTNERDE